MKEFSTEQIQGQFEKLPADLQAAITSPEIHDKIEAADGPIAALYRDYSGQGQSVWPQDRVLPARVRRCVIMT